ncbi:hypothetical protein ARMSODRAFT_975843 [Armillaria solidipes]|uniref:Uncharacterized protein n=1 Tax=Armillaria solidipes TaxID=1076256 RepID=A0A2H3BZG4_9AGAR|nr:hypothetical protein ARMSODRAFT_975843 [Armillaria solidipes]
MPKVDSKSGDTETSFTVNSQREIKKLMTTLIGRGTGKDVKDLISLKASAEGLISESADIPVGKCRSRPREDHTALDIGLSRQIIIPRARKSPLAEKCLVLALVNVIPWGIMPRNDESSSLEREKVILDSYRCFIRRSLPSYFGVNQSLRRDESPREALIQTRRCNTVGLAALWPQDSRRRIVVPEAGYLVEMIDHRPKGYAYTQAGVEVLALIFRGDVRDNVPREKVCSEEFPVEPKSRMNNLTINPWGAKAAKEGK